MDEMRIADQASRREALRPLGLLRTTRQRTTDQMALTGADAEVLALPPASSRDLNGADGTPLFLVGSTSPFSADTVLEW